jgi:hypothetical protein
MQNDTTATAWHDIKKQIRDLRIDTQIEDLRGRLAEDWNFRVSSRESEAVAPDSVLGVPHS